MARGLRVKGLREFVRACDRSAKHVKKDTRARLRRVGNIVRDEVRSLFSATDARSAAGYRTVVRSRGVAVEQSLRRTTGQRPDYGAKQMRDALLPALASKENEVVEEFEQMLDNVARDF